MKTNEVKACVTRQLRRLQVLPEPQRRAELAELRRGVGRQPGDLPALWGALLADMPEQLQGSNGPSKAEWAVYTALTLFALHQQGEAGVSMNQPGRTLGGAVRQLAEKTAAGQDWTESSVLRRFNALATADSMPEVSHHLRGMIQLLRREGIPLDYPQLAEDLYQYQFVDGAPNVRLRWGPGPLCEPHGENQRERKGELRWIPNACMLIFMFCRPCRPAASTATTPAAPRPLSMAGPSVPGCPRRRGSTPCA